MMSVATPAAAPLPHPSKTPVLAPGDSSLLRVLKNNLDRRQKLTAPEKLYLHTDRTLYQPGETAWFCAYVCNAGDLLPSLQSQVVYVELTDPRGSVVQQKTLLALLGKAAGEFDFITGLPGGLYKIRAYTRWMQNTEDVFERTLTLQQVVLPNINMKLEFERKAFGPGDVAIARFDAFSLDNKAIAGRKAGFKATAGGREIAAGNVETNTDGRAYVRFQLPDSLSTTDVLLNIMIEHESRTEALSRAVPVVLNRIDLQFFPEGGDAVAGMPCRMAFKAVNEFGKPADVEGFITDSRGARVAGFSSYHNGMGAFDFVPRSGEQYTAQLLRPVASEKTWPLPQVKATGFALRLQQRGAEELKFEVASSASGKMYLVGQSRDKLFFFKEIQAGNGSVTVPVKDLPVGIARFTLFDAQLTEQAERLAFLHCDRGLNIEIRPDKDMYLPREKVSLKIRVSDHAGRPVSGNFSLAVSDENQLAFADDKQGHLLSSLLLEQDLRGKIEEPGFYFDRSEPKSEQALDYLLMTQGWRRFEWREVLENQPVNHAYAPERAVVNGRVLHSDGKPWKNADVWFHPSGPRGKTDKNGYFSFINPPVETCSHIAFGNSEYRTLYGFDNNMVLQSGTTPSPAQSGSRDRRKPVVATEKLYQAQLIEQDKTRGGQTLTSDEIRNIPTRPVNAMVATTPGEISVENGEINIKGSRSNATNYYIDGVRVSGNMPPVMDLDQLEVVTGGLGAEFGDVTGGAVLENVDDAASPAAKDVPANFGKRASEKWISDSVTPGLKVERKKEAPSYQQRHIYSKARVFYMPRYDIQTTPAQRIDFRSTIYWNPEVTTDRKGEASVEFYTSDAVTNFRATLEGIGQNGEAAHAEHKFFVQKPFSISAKVPAMVIEGDVLKLAVAVSNKTSVACGGRIQISRPEHFTPVGNMSEWIQLAAGETQTLVYEYKTGKAASENGTFGIRLMADENTLDGFEANIRTIERGFPVRQVASGNAAQNAFSIRLENPIEGTLTANITAQPGALEELLQGMERMLRQPSGCFEQVSSSNYPNLLVLDLLRRSGANRPEVESRAMNMLQDGYKKLTAYECKTGGFDWYGRDPGHEGLTAYGLLQFTDMARVFDVDKKMVERTVDWLLSRRDGKGSWNVNPNSLHGWQKDNVMDSYIVWAVAEAGYGKQFRAEIEQTRQRAMNSRDPYQLALLANALLSMDDIRGHDLLSILYDMQQEDGSWIGSSHSVLHAQGVCFRIETTALGAMALMRANKEPEALKKAMDFIMRSKNEYGYGSTQSTIMALKAIAMYISGNTPSEAEGNMVVMVDGKRVAEAPVSKKSPRRIEVKNLEQHFSNNKPRVEVFFDKSDVAIPFELEVKYASRMPRNTPGCPISLQTKLGAAEARIGETVRLSAVLKNETGEVQASPMVVLGIPAGLTLQPWQLKKLVDEKKCDFYELWEGFAVFHFDAIAAGETRTLDLDLRADIAGTFEAPASQAFLYYSNDQRVWSKPEQLTIR